VWPAITLFVGFFSSAALDFFRDQRLTSRERAARDADNRAKRIESRNMFQKENLLQLQEECMKLARATGAINHNDIMVYKSTGEWRKNLTPDDWGDEHLQALQRINILSSRVSDEQVRQAVNNFKGQAVSVLESDTREAGDRSLHQMANIFVELNEKIGTVIRKIDEF